jgi:hypothetical protein
MCCALRQDAVTTLLQHTPSALRGYSGGVDPAVLDAHDISCHFAAVAGRADALDVDNAELRRRLDAATAALQRCQKSAQDSAVREEQLSSRVRLLQTRVDDANARALAAETAVYREERRAAEAAGKVVALEAQLSGARALLSDVKQELAEARLHGAAVGLQRVDGGEATELRQRCDRLVDANAKLAAQLSQLQVEQQTLREAAQVCGVACLTCRCCWCRFSLLYIALLHTTVADEPGGVLLVLRFLLLSSAWRCPVGGDATSSAARHRRRTRRVTTRRLPRPPLRASTRCSACCRRV